MGNHKTKICEVRLKELGIFNLEKRKRECGSILQILERRGKGHNFSIIALCILIDIVSRTSVNFREKNVLNQRAVIQWN